MSFESNYCLTPSSGKLFVYTFKEGVFSSVSHDLLLEVTDFKVHLTVPNGEMAAAGISLEASSDSLKVICAMKKGKRQPGILKRKDKYDIKTFMENDVLHTSKYHKITFQSIEIQQEDTYYRVKGKLFLHGTIKIITFKLKSDDGKRFKGAVILSQTHFGIKPFNALMGTLKVRNRIKIGFDLAL